MGRILFFGDTQVHPWETGGVPVDFPVGARTVRVNSRVLDCLTPFLVLPRLVQEHDVSLVVFLGDLYESIGSRGSLTSAVTEYVIYRAFAGGQTRFLMLPGNHDRVDARGTLTVLEAFLGWSGVVVADTPHIVGFAGIPVTLCVIPWQSSNEAFSAALRACVPNGNRPAILVCHQGMRRGTVGPDERYHPPDDWEPDSGLLAPFSMIVSGHYHNRQGIGVGDRTWVYVGAPIQHTFGDRNQQRGAFLLDVDDPDGTRFIDLQDYRPTPRFWKVGADEDVLAILDAGYRAGDCVWVDDALSGDAMAVLEAVRPAHLRISPKAPEVSEARLGLSLAHGLQDWVRAYVEAKPPPGDANEAVAEAMRLIEGAP